MAHPTDYLHGLRARTAQEGRMLSCLWEVTARCNLGCRHCYHPRHEAAPGELTTERAMHLLEELAAKDIFILLISGGEPFSRPDIWEILEEARRLEFAVRVLTNGTLLDRPAAERLAALMPLSVDLSLYGQRRVHESVTGLAGSFQTTCRTGRLLTQNGVRVTVKMPLMRYNLGEYRAVRQVADSWGAALVSDASIFCRLDGDRTPLEAQASPEQMLEFLLRRVQETGPYRPGSNVAGADPGRALCSAGRSSMFVASDGKVHPCVIWRQELGDLARQSLEEILAGPELTVVRGMTVSDLAECPTCRLARWCVRCPGLAKLETGSATAKSPSLCRLAALSQAVEGRLQAASYGGEPLG